MSAHIVFIHLISLYNRGRLSSDTIRKFGGKGSYFIRRGGRAVALTIGFRIPNRETTERKTAI